MNILLHSKKVMVNTFDCAPTIVQVIQASFARNYTYAEAVALRDALSRAIDIADGNQMLVEAYASSSTPSKSFMALPPGVTLSARKPRGSRVF